MERFQHFVRHTDSSGTVTTGPAALVQMNNGLDGVTSISDDVKRTADTIAQFLTLVPGSSLTKAKANLENVKKLGQANLSKLTSKRTVKTPAAKKKGTAASSSMDAATEDALALFMPAA